MLDINCCILMSENIKRNSYEQTKPFGEQVN